MAGACTCGDETSGSTKRGEFKVTHVSCSKLFDNVYCNKCTALQTAVYIYIYDTSATRFGLYRAPSPSGYKGTAVAEHGQMRSYNAEIYMDSEVQVKVQSVATPANVCYLFPNLKNFNVPLKVA